MGGGALRCKGHDSKGARGEDEGGVDVRVLGRAVGSEVVREYEFICYLV